MSENNDTAAWAVPNWSRKKAPGLAAFALDNKDSWPKVSDDIKMAFMGKWGEEADPKTFPFKNDGSYVEPEAPPENKAKVNSGPGEVKTWTCDRKCYGETGKLYRPGDSIVTNMPPSDYFIDGEGNRRPGATPSMKKAGKQGRKVNHPLIKTPKTAADPSDVKAIKEMSLNNADPDNIAKTLNIDPDLVWAIVAGAG